jgi:hypothetical protein
MKPSSQSPRTPSRLSDSVHRQLNMYALAASAAGVGVLALSQPAEGKIVYTPVHKYIGPGHSFRLDLNHDGKIDFTLSNAATCGTDQCHDVLFQKPAPGNSAVGYIWDSSRLLASALNRGAHIGRGAAFQKGRAILEAIFFSSQGESTGVYGRWYDVNGHYLGLKFQIGGQTHYGWARLNVELAGKTIDALLTGYAYETIPSMPIIAGKTKEPEVITLEPGSLGHLARGSGTRIGK